MRSARRRRDQRHRERILRLRRKRRPNPAFRLKFADQSAAETASQGRAPMAARAAAISIVARSAPPHLNSGTISRIVRPAKGPLWARGRPRRCLNCAQGRVHGGRASEVSLVSIIRVKPEADHSTAIVRRFVHRSSPSSSSAPPISGGKHEARARSCPAWSGSATTNRISSRERPRFLDQ